MQAPLEAAAQPLPASLPWVPAALPKGPGLVPLLPGDTYHVSSFSSSVLSHPILPTSGTMLTPCPVPRVTNHLPAEKMRAPGLLFPVTIPGAYLALIRRKGGREERRRKKGKKGRERESNRKKEETEIGVETITCPNHPEGQLPSWPAFSVT